MKKLPKYNRLGETQKSCLVIWKTIVEEEPKYKRGGMVPTRKGSGSSKIALAIIFGQTSKLVKIREQAIRRMPYNDTSIHSKHHLF